MVSYGAGDDVCGKGVQAKTEIRLSCGSTVGHPVLIRSHIHSHTLTWRKTSSHVKAGPTIRGDTD